MSESVVEEYGARERGFTIVRTFAAPPAEVFAAWTDPEKLGWFFNPEVPIEKDVEVDLRVDGVWRLKMWVDEDNQYFTGGLYREIVPPERLVFRWGAVDGWPEIDPHNPDDGPLVTLTFTPSGAGTVMSFDLDLPEHLDQEKVREWFATGMQQGWSQTLDRLAPDGAR